MTDLIRQAGEVARAAWQEQDIIAELRKEIEEEREVIGIIARERKELRAEVAELRADKAGLAMRLTHALDRERQLRAVRTRDWSGLLMLAWWKLTRRM